jgi:hypothetical protein
MNRQKRRAAGRHGPSKHSPNVRRHRSEDFYGLTQHWDADLVPGHLIQIWVTHAPDCPMPDTGEQASCNCAHGPNFCERR